VDFDLTAEQHLLQEEVRRFCLDRFPLEVARSFGDPGGFDPDRWRELAKLGVFELAVAEPGDGSGLGAVDATLVFEELGRALVPGPLLGCVLAASILPGVATGDVVVTIVDRPTAGPALVEHLGAADAVMVVDDHGVWEVGSAELSEARTRVPLDPTAPVWSVESLPGGTLVAGPDTARRWRVTGSLLASAMLTGIAGGTTDLAVAYAKDRHQFGRPIGSFQAVKHLLADMLARTEVSRASVYAAGAVLDEPAAGDLDRAVAGARVVAGHAGVANAKGCIQVHGGIGFTWEASPHLFVKRAWALATTFGSVDDAAEQVARSLHGRPSSPAPDR
jgi:alkylation response protein AidB-like acyl-CoA dehydrogenase